MSLDLKNTVFLLRKAISSPKMSVGGGRRGIPVSKRGRKWEKQLRR
jgi:hypothetical protein